MMALLATALQTTLLGFRVRIVDPVWLWLSPLGIAAGATAAFCVWRRWRRARSAVPATRREQVLPGGGASQGVLRGGLLGIGLSLLSVAAAGPQCGERTEIVKRTGIDLVVALDASTSMLARDVKPSRLERAKVEVTALLDRLRGDRVGLVVFAGEAFVQCPLTTDYSAAKLFLRAVDPAAMPQQGTAIAGALREARRVLDGGARGGAGGEPQRREPQPDRIDDAHAESQQRSLQRGGNQDHHGVPDKRVVRRASPNIPSSAAGRNMRPYHSSYWAEPPAS